MALITAPCPPQVLVRDVSAWLNGRAGHLGLATGGLVPPKDQAGGLRAKPVCPIGNPREVMIAWSGLSVPTEKAW